MPRRVMKAEGKPAAKKPAKVLRETLGRRKESSTFFPVQAPRALHTVEWPVAEPWPLGDFAGAIVRVRVTGEAEGLEAALAEARKHCEKLFVVPAPKPEAVPAESKKRAQARVASARAVVLELVEGANTARRRELRELAERVMGEVGL